MEGLPHFEPLLEGISGEGGAPDAVGGLNDALEGGEFPELFLLLRAHHLEESLYLLLRLLAAVARELLRKHRGRRLRDGASASGKAHLFEGAILHLRVHCHHVAAQRVINVFMDVGILQLAPVTRMLEVVEQDLSVEALHHLAEDCIRSVQSFVSSCIAPPRLGYSPWRRCHSSRDSSGYSGNWISPSPVGMSHHVGA